MRILSVVGKGFGGSENAIEPLYLEFRDPLLALGHHVEHFDHAVARRRFGLDGCGQRFVDTVRRGGYEAVLYQTAGQDWMSREAIREAGLACPIVAWNSDDDWQWESYSRHLAPYFTFVVTTYPHIFDQHRAEFPNLRLSQWGCYDRFADAARRKDLAFTFVGQIYGRRNEECRFLGRKAGLLAFGPGSGLVRMGLPHLRGAWRVPAVYGRAFRFDEANGIWNRSRVSYTPMGASVDPLILQIKSRAFEMGLSGTLMLCQLSPNLDRYYEPGKEFVPFGDLEDCARKANYYLAHDSERQRIADAYRKRTAGEHLWQHRFEQLFRDIGLAEHC